VELFVLHKADTVPAASVGDPPLEDAKPTLAPNVTKQTMSDYYSAMNPAAYPPRTIATTAPLAPSEPNSTPPAPPSAASTAPLTLQDVPTAAAGDQTGASAVVTNVPEVTPATSSSGNSMAVEIVQHSSNSPAPGPAPASPPAFPGSESPAPAQPATTAAATAPPPDDNGGMKPLGPTTPAALPPIEKPAAAPDAINEVTPGSQPPAQTAPANGKKPKPAFDKADESSSKHKKKKGLAKLNPF
jgi:outer membrane protein assembly factor BamD